MAHCVLRTLQEEEKQFFSISFKTNTVAAHHCICYQHPCISFSMAFVPAYNSYCISAATIYTMADRCLLCSKQQAKANTDSRKIISTIIQRPINPNLLNKKNKATIKTMLMRSNIMKSMLLLLGSTLTFAACNNSGNNTNNTSDSVKAKLQEAGQKVENAANTVGEKIKTAADTIADKARNAFNNNPDSAFVVKATVSNEKELKILEAGVEKGTNKALKSDAKKMIADHKKLRAALKSYGASKNYTLPNENEIENGDITTINNNHQLGNDWDNAWTNQLITDHKNDIDDFEKAHDKVKGPALSKLITNTLPTLHMHLDMMNKLQSDLPK